MAETITLDPSEVAASGRVQLDITAWVGQAGLDWGDSALSLYKAQQTWGETVVDSWAPNRTVTIPIVIKSADATSFQTARSQIQAWVSRVQTDHEGWIKRQLSDGTYYFADVVDATLHMPANWMQAHRNAQTEATLTLSCLPDFYGDPITLSDHVETTNPELIAVEATVKGNYPGRLESLTVDEDQGVDQLGLKAAFRCRHYDSAATAALAYEAEALTPLDAATQATLSGASGGTFNSILHNNLSTSWTPVVGTNMVPAVRSVGAVASGTGDITPALPAGVVANDILVMYVETGNEAVNVPSGWAHTANSPTSMATANATRLSVLWKRAIAGETAPKLVDPGDHQVARIIAVSGCIASGNPWDTTSTSTEATSDTSVSITGATTTVNGCLVLTGIATGTDVSSSANISGWTNTDLQGLTEQIDSWVTDGNGGGIGVASGIKLVAGAYGATTATLVNADTKAMHTLALKPPTSGNYLTHQGTYRVMARVYTAFTTQTSLRFVYDVGDFTNPTENDPATIPGANSFYLVDLGELRLDAASVGTHRWQGAIQAMGASNGVNVYIDRVWFWPMDEGCVTLAAPLNTSIGLATYSARDAFNQAAGALASKSLDIGGTWSGVGDTDDFSINATAHVAQRTALSDAAGGLANGRLEIAGAASLAQCITQVDMTQQQNVAVLNSDYIGLLFRYTNISNFAAVTLNLPQVQLGLYKVKGGVQSTVNVSRSLGAIYPGYPYTPDSTYSIRLLATANGVVAAWLLVDGTLVDEKPLLIAQHADFATGGTLATGNVGLIDYYPDPYANTRTYDNFAAWAPYSDAAAFSGQSAYLRTDGNLRESSDGLSVGPITDQTGDLLRIPVSGDEGRPVEMMVKLSPGVFGQTPDSSYGKLSAQITYRPSWLMVPGA